MMEQLDSFDMTTIAASKRQRRNRIRFFVVVVFIIVSIIAISLLLVVILDTGVLVPFITEHKNVFFTGSLSPLFLKKKKDENITFISGGGSSSANAKQHGSSNDHDDGNPNSGILAMDIKQNITSFALLDSLLHDNKGKDDKEQAIQNENDESEDNVNVNNNIRGASLDEDSSNTHSHNYDESQSDNDYGYDEDDYYYNTNQNDNDGQVSDENAAFFSNDKSSFLPKEDQENEEASRELRYGYYGYPTRTIYYSPRQNFCLSRPCLDNLDCGGCNGGCSTGGYCLSLNQNRYYGYNNRYSNHNRYYYRNRYYNRYYYGNNIYYNTYYGVTARPTCNTNLDCVANLPHCIRGICQATNYGQFCSDNPGCANGIYNQCINSACTGQIIDGRYYTNTRVVNCVATEDELRIRLQGGSGRIIDICSPSTINVSDELVSNIQNLELNCIVAGTTAFGNNCVFEAQGRTRILTLTGNSVIIRGMTFNGGSSSSNGGAIDLLGNGQHQILDCTFNGNRAVQRGGAVHIPYSSDVILIGTTFNGNTASQCFNVYAQGTCRNS